MTQQFHCWDFTLRTLKHQPKKPVHPNVHSSTIYNSQVVEATEVPTSKRVDPKTMVYLHNGILRSREKDGAYTLCNRMDGTGEHYAM